MPTPLGTRENPWQNRDDQTYNMEPPTHIPEEKDTQGVDTSERACEQNEPNQDPPRIYTTQEEETEATHAGAHEHMDENTDANDDPAENGMGECDDHIMDGLVHPNHIELPDETEDPIDATVHADPIQPIFIRVEKGKRKHKPDPNCQQFLGEWIGQVNPLNHPSHLRVTFANFGGKLKPWGASGHTISDNRLDASKELLRLKRVDMVLLTEGHIDGPTASMIEEHGRTYNYHAIVAPTSANTAQAIEEFGDTSKRTPSAGVAALLSPELAKRVRGPAQKLASGRVLHFTLEMAKEYQPPMQVSASHSLITRFTKQKPKTEQTKTLLTTYWPTGWSLMIDFILHEQAIDDLEVRCNSSESSTSKCYAAYGQFNQYYYFLVAFRAKQIKSLRQDLWV